MNRRLILAGLAATGGLVTSAFLQVAVAAADTAGPDAFTIGDFTFDPINASGVEGFDPVPPLVGAPPLLEIGGGTPLGILEIAPQNFDVFDPTSGADLGSIGTGETVTDLFGLINSEFTVESVTPADGGSTSDLPAVGSVYDALNLGNGYENIYTAIPGANGAPDTVTDMLITPNGDINLDSLFGSFDAAAPLNPGDAFTGLEAGDSSIGPDAFSIGGFTFDPGPNGFDTIPALTASPPLLDIGGGTLEGTFFDFQNLDVYSGTGSAATEVGTIRTGENVTDLLGLTNTELVVQSATPTGDATAADLPTVGSVYDAFNFGNGYENVYTDIVSATGGANTVSDELVTPFGNINLDSLFGGIDAAAPLSPGDAFTGLQAGDSSIGADAFSIGGTTFDPTLAAGGEGFDPVAQLTAAPPFLQIGGGALNLGPGFGSVPLAAQDFNVYDGTETGATEVGNINTSEAVTNLLGLTNTEFTVDSVTGTSTDLPTVGSVYDVFNIGDGIENVYTAIPGVDGAADTVTDTLVTPWGDLNLDSLFGAIDAVVPLDPGDAFTAGLDAASAAATAIDPLSFLGL
ncbi:MAG: hypothetical protein WB785_09490 [Mycobacterium sp.]|uniref:hypothetical protein n=1 Tax=Mycobacterium sp. TaxID=1785 RepID=UPI003C57543F